MAALGHSDAGDRVIPTEDLEVAALDRTRTQPRKFLRLRAARLVEILADRGPEEPAAAEAEDAVPGAPSTQPVPDDPADPTDQVSGATPPLEHPVTGEPTTPPGGTARRAARLSSGAGSDRPGRPRGGPAAGSPAAGSRADRTGPDHAGADDAGFASAALGAGQHLRLAD